MSDLGQGFTKNLYMILIITLVVGLIIGGFVLIATLAPVFFGGAGELINVVNTDLETKDPGSDLTNVTIQTTGLASSFLGIGEFMIYIIMVGLCFGFIVIALYVKEYPFLAYIWVFIVIFFVIASIVFTDMYLQASQDPNLAGFYKAWGTNDFIMSKLPFIVTVFGVITGIVLFSLSTRDKEGENVNI